MTLPAKTCTTGHQKVMLKGAHFLTTFSPRLKKMLIFQTFSMIPSSSIIKKNRKCEIHFSTIFCTKGKLNGEKDISMPLVRVQRVFDK